MLLINAVLDTLLLAYNLVTRVREIATYVLEHPPVPMMSLLVCSTLDRSLDKASRSPAKPVTVNTRPRDREYIQRHLDLCYSIASVVING